MKTIILDGAEMTDNAAAHAHIAQMMGFPQWYGNNLDALWDMLSTYDEADIRLTNAPAMLGALKGYGCRLLKCFYDAVDENYQIAFTVI